MIINNLLFVINSKLEFVDGTTRYGYLTANDINKDMLYVISPFPYSTDIRATFKNYEQGEQGVTVFFKKSKKKIEDLIDKDNKTTPYELVKDWNVWQSIMPNKALTYVAGNRGGDIEVSFSYREHLPPSIPDGVEYQGEIYSVNNIGGYGAYLVKTNLLELDEGVFANYNDLIIYEGTFSLIRAIIQKGGTAPITYEVDPNIKDEDYEIVEFDLVSSLISMVGDVADDVQGLDNEINNILNKNIEQDGRLDVNEAELIRLDGRIDDIDVESGKQDKLIAGNNITIDPNTNVISSKDERLDDEVIRVEQKVDTHIEDLNNPHGVTAEQVDTYVKTTIDNKDTAIMNKANNLENANMIKDVVYNNVNGVLTFTRYDDTTKEIDLPLELLVESGYYDEVANELVLVLANSSEIRIPVGNLLTDLDAHNIRFNGSGTNYLVNKNDVESAVKELDTQVKTNIDLLEEIEKNVNSLYIEEELNFVFGGFYLGIPQASETFIRSSMFRVKKGDVLSCTTVAKYRVSYFDDDGEFLSQTPYTDGGSIYEFTDGYVVVSGALVSEEALSLEEIASNFKVLVFKEHMLNKVKFNLTNINVGGIYWGENNKISVVSSEYRVYIAIDVKIGEKIKANTGYELMIYYVNDSGNVVAQTLTWSSEIIVDKKMKAYIKCRKSDDTYITPYDFYTNVVYYSFEKQKEEISKNIPSYIKTDFLTNKVRKDFDSNWFRIPFVEITNNDVLICGGDVRYPFNNDTTKIDIGISRSFDYGKTFKDRRILLANNGIVTNSRKTCASILVDRNTNRVFVFAISVDSDQSWESETNPSNIVTDLVYKYSDDDGENWSNEISLKSLFDSSMASLLPGLGKGITMQNGTLVVPAQIRNASGYNGINDNMPIQSCLLYSVDNGVTWALSSRLPVYTSEASIIEYEPGKIMINCRSYVSARRVYTTDDLGATWTVHESDQTLIEPVANHAGLDKIEVFERTKFLFINTHDLEARKNITLQISDDLVNWNKYAMIDARNHSSDDWSGYVNITNKDGYIYIANEYKGVLTVYRMPVSFDMVGLYVEPEYEFEMFKQQLRGYNFLMPDLTDKTEISAGVYRLGNNSGVTFDYNVNNGQYVLNGTPTSNVLSFIQTFNIQPMQGTLSLNVISGTSNLGAIFWNSEYVDHVLLSNVSGGNRVKNDVNITQVMDYITFSDYTITPYDNYTFTMQLEKGTTATPYTVPGQIPQYKIVGES